MLLLLLLPPVRLPAPSAAPVRTAVIFLHVCIFSEKCTCLGCFPVLKASGVVVLVLVLVPNTRRRSGVSRSSRVSLSCAGPEHPEAFRSFEVVELVEDGLVRLLGFPEPYPSGPTPWESVRSLRSLSYSSSWHLTARSISLRRPRIWAGPSVAVVDVVRGAWTGGAWTGGAWTGGAWTGGLGHPEGRWAPDR